MSCRLPPEVVVRSRSPLTARAKVYVAPWGNATGASCGKAWGLPPRRDGCQWRLDSLVKGRLQFGLAWKTGDNPASLQSKSPNKGDLTWYMK